jgi:hypothetical protein
MIEPGIAARIDRALTDLRAFGAEIASHDLGYPVEAATFEPGASEGRIEAVAALVADPLPPEYRYFLGRCAGLLGMDFHNGYAVHTPEQVVRLVRSGGVPARIVTSNGATGILPVGSDGGGNPFLLSLGPENPVFRWDHETGGARSEVPADDASLDLVAVGFATFLERMRDDWRHFLGSEPGAWDYIT